MEGLVYVVDKLGVALAQAERENTALKQRVAVLEEQLAAKSNGPGDGDGSS